MAISKKRGWAVRVGVYYRITTALAVAIAAFFLEPGTLSLQTLWIIGWYAGALAYLALAWALILAADAQETREHTLSQDPGAYVIFLLVVSAACASIVAIGFVVSSVKELPFWPKAFGLCLAAVALISSWLLIHTVFAFHYARSYYSPLHHAPGEAHGMAFPNDRTPDYLDFAYYSFVVGMTSQVSDVPTTTRRVRRLTLMHGILSFVFNITVLALAMNLLASVI